MIRVIVSKEMFLKDESSILKFSKMVSDGFTVRLLNGEGGKTVRRKSKRRRKARTALTLVDKGKMKELRKSGLTYRVIGQRYGITEAYAWQVVNGRVAAKRKGSAVEKMVEGK
jgi:hypothetical protein